MTEPQSDRAEQAKALIAETPIRVLGAMTDASEDECYRIARFAERLTAALTASEAEVARLQAGIAEAPHSYSCISKTPSKATDCDCWKAALSQPTTDTNGAHDV